MVTAAEQEAIKNYMASIRPKQKNKDGMLYLDVGKLKWQHSRGRLWGVRLEKFLILRRDGYVCVKCGSKQHLTIDRIREPGEKGPSHNSMTHYDPTSCQTLCVDCHRKLEEERDNNVTDRNI
jgi:5-methylcytosine-specific restriction endonuclease McrA